MEESIDVAVIFLPSFSAVAEAFRFSLASFAAIAICSPVGNWLPFCAVARVQMSNSSAMYKTLSL